MKEIKGKGIEIERKEGNYDNMYEMLSMLPEVKSSIKENITSDYTLAVLNKDEKEFITDNYGNAEYAKEIIDRYGKKGYRYVWDEKKMDWIRAEDGSYKKEELIDEDKKRLFMIADRIFTFFMIQPHLIAILNRNKIDNFMVKLLGKSSDEEDKPIQLEKENKSILQRMGDFFRGKSKDEEDDTD